MTTIAQSTAADYLTFSVNQLVTDYKLRTRTAPTQDVTVTNITDVFIITVLIEDNFAGSNISPNQLILGPKESKTFRITYDIGLLETLPVGSIPASITFTATAEPIQFPPPPPPPPLPPAPPPPPVVVRGCTDTSALNYLPIANLDDGSCIPKIYGCTNPVALNYDRTATVDSGQCEFEAPVQPPPVRGCTIQNSINYNPNAQQDDGSCIPIVAGCRDADALNYNPNANRDGERCLYRQPIEGCMDRRAKNYNELATIAKNDECDYEIDNPTIYDCMDKSAKNYNPLATQPKVPDNCIPYPILGCMDRRACNYVPTATEDDGSCIIRNPCVDVPGCTDPNAKNYMPSANVNDGSCEYEPEKCGCMDQEAKNYNPEAVKPCGTCEYWNYGCTNKDAYNYERTADKDDGSCYFIACTNPDARNYVPESDSVRGCPNDTCCQFRCGIGGGQPCTTIGNIVSVGPADANGYALVCRHEQLRDVDGCLAGCDTQCLNEFVGKPDVFGCMDPEACNYNPDATKDDGKCEPCTGCTNKLAKNYNPKAKVDDGSCVEWKIGCMDTTAKNYDPTAEINLQALCQPTVFGCTNPNALNYMPSATDDDGSCKTKQITTGGGGGTAPDCISDQECMYSGDGAYRNLICSQGRCISRGSGVDIENAT